MSASTIGVVYFLDAPEVNRIKIGTGIAPEERLSAVRLMCPVATILLGIVRGGRAREAELHSQCCHLRRHGEWFEGTEELRAAIEYMLLVDAWEGASPATRAWFRENVVDVPVMDAAE